MTPARLLLCYDGSADAKAAVGRAARMFGPRPSMVVCVWDPGRGETKGEALSLAAEGAKLAEAHGLAPVEAIALRCADSVWETIVDASATLDASVTVLGSRGRAGTRSPLLGSVTDHVVHHARRPTFVARHATSETTGTRTVLAYDGSDDSRVAIETAGRLLGTDSVVVLAIWQHPQAALSSFWAGMADVSGQEELVAAAEQAATTCAIEGADLAAAAGLSAESLVRQTRGPVWPAILEAADELDAGVIVLGSRGLSGIQTVMLGSVSDAVLHHTRRPVLVVRHGSVLEPATKSAGAHIPQRDQGATRAL